MLENFRGDLSFIVKNEVHPNPRLQGRAYVPAPKTSSSGITLDVGIDCGHVSSSFVKEIYGDVLTPEQLNALSMVRGIYGMSAKRFLDKSDIIKSIRIPIQKAIEVFPYAADKYWVGTIRRWNELVDPDVPGCVHTAILDLTYNRGYGNGHLRVLNQAIINKNWYQLAQLLMNMQQRHRVNHVRWRRRQEGKLIMDWLDGQDKVSLGNEVTFMMPRDERMQIERNFLAGEFFVGEHGAKRFYTGIANMLQRIRTRFGSAIYILDYVHGSHIEFKVKYRYNKMNNNLVESVCDYAKNIGANIVDASINSIKLWIR